MPQVPRCAVIRYQENYEGPLKAYSPICDYPEAYRIYFGGKIIAKTSLRDTDEIWRIRKELRKTGRPHLLVSDLHLISDTIPKIKLNYGRLL